MDTIGFIGSGNMAEALIKGIINADLCTADNILISDIKEDRLRLLTGSYGVAAAETNCEAAEKAGILILSVKPQDMAEVLDSIKDALRPDALVISIAAGIRIATIAAALGDIAVVRVMPNTGALIGEGASALYANDKAKPVLDKALAIFSAVGKAVVVADEDLIDAVTAVSGSGPAYYFLLMEEMIKTAVELGLPADVAKDLVLQTARGAGLLAVEADKAGQTPQILRSRVTSPGGTTEAALKVFAQRSFGEIVTAALTAARDRSRRLSADK